MSEDHGSYLALFEGVMTGEVRNPITGRVYQRREFMEFYRSLLFKACRRPVDKGTIEMLEMVRSFLDVPSDIHLSLLIEARDAPKGHPQQGPSEEMRRDMESSFERWNAQHLAHQVTASGLFNDFIAGSMEVERSGLLGSDYQVIQVAKRARAAPEDDVKLPPGFTFRAKDLKSFTDQFVKP